jgi:hypothetical protein
VPGGNPVDGIGIVRYPDAASGQLLTESYRSGTGDRWGLCERSDALGQLLGPEHGRLPDPRAGGVVKRREDLAAPAVQHRQPLARGAGLADPHRQCVERANAAQRQAEADAEAAGGRDPHPQAGEGAGAEPDRDQVDRVPAARRRSRTLDLLQQAGRMQGSPLRGQAQLRLVQDFTVAPGAGDGVNRRGVEADDVQSVATP